MSSRPCAAPVRRFAAYGACLVCALGLVAGVPGTLAAQERPAAAILLDRLCADSLRANEEDRLYGLISLTVRATVKYEGGVFSPDLIDDAVQDGLGTLLDACPKIAATGDAQRLGMAVALIREATIKRLQDRQAGYSDRQRERATAADLSEELSAPEIDAWLDGLAPRQRALALLLYASADVTHQQVAAAVGLSPPALAAGFRAVKTNLLQFFREEWDSAAPPPIPPRPAMEFREAPQQLAELLRSDPERSASATIRGISDEIYAGWSLLAIVTGLPADRDLDVRAPILIEPDRRGGKRMIVVGLDEIGDRHDEPRRFLLKAFAIDAEGHGAGLHDAFHLGAGIDNAAAQRTLHNRGLATSEIARCLAFDYGTAADPGLCREGGPVTAQAAGQDRNQGARIDASGAAGPDDRTHPAPAPVRR